VRRGHADAHADAALDNFVADISRGYIASEDASSALFERVDDFRILEHAGYTSPAPKAANVFVASKCFSIGKRNTPAFVFVACGRLFVALRSLQVAQSCEYYVAKDRRAKEALLHELHPIEASSACNFHPYFSWLVCVMHGELKRQDATVDYKTLPCNDVIDAALLAAAENVVVVVCPKGLLGHVSTLSKMTMNVPHEDISIAMAHAHLEAFQKTFVSQTEATATNDKIPQEWFDLLQRIGTPDAEKAETADSERFIDAMADVAHKSKTRNRKRRIECGEDSDDSADSEDDSDPDSGDDSDPDSGDDSDPDSGDDSDPDSDDDSDPDSDDDSDKEDDDEEDEQSEAGEFSDAIDTPGKHSVSTIDSENSSGSILNDSSSAAESVEMCRRPSSSHASKKKRRLVKMGAPEGDALDDEPSAPIPKQSGKVGRPRVNSPRRTARDERDRIAKNALQMLDEVSDCAAVPIHIARKLESTRLALSRAYDTFVEKKPVMQELYTLLHNHTLLASTLVQIQNTTVTKEERAQESAVAVSVAKAEIHKGVNVKSHLVDMDAVMQQRNAVAEQCRLLDAKLMASVAAAHAAVENRPNTPSDATAGGE